jgi:HK97 family phage portal protein
MDLLGRLLTGTDLQAAYGPTDDFWYQPFGAGVNTAAGVRISPDGARKISAWFRGRDLLATSLAMLPLQLLQRLPDDEGATVARSNPLYDALHRKPNAADDSFTWRRQQMYDLIDYGHGYNWIGVGQAWTLDRIDPTYVQTERLKRGPNKGRLLFHVRDEDSGQTTVHTQDEVFHLCRGDGKGILDEARESLGNAMATEQYAARVYGSGTLNGGIIEHPGTLDDESARRMAKSWITKPGEWHFPKILEQGSKFTANLLTPDKAQMLDSRKFSINDIARWLGLPPHMLGDLDRATFSNIEHQGQEFVTYSLGPWLSLWEFAINDQLILQPNRFYAEFTRDALVRGDIAARWAAYQIAVSTGTFTRNEVRRKENLNALEGLDEPLDPAFLSGKHPANGPAPEEPPPPPDQPSKAQAIAQASAARLLRKEVAAMQKIAVKCAANPDAFAVAVTEFYVAHADLVSETLSMALDQAQGYCAGQASQIVSGSWLAALELWRSEDYAAGLAAIALEAA